MKNTQNLLLLLFLFFLSSCSIPESEQKKIRYQVGEGSHVEVVLIDGCEYLYGPWGNATVLTHKGNCKNHKK